MKFPPQFPGPLPCPAAACFRHPAYCFRHLALSSWLQSDLPPPEPPSTQPSTPSAAAKTSHMITEAGYARLAVVQGGYDPRAVDTPQIGHPPASRTCSISRKEFGRMTARPSYDSASVALRMPHFEDLSVLRVSDSNTVSCIKQKERGRGR
jgi:hypothetical protein